MRIAALIATVFFLCSTAFASETNWKCVFRASSANDTNYSMSTVGTTPESRDNKDNTDVSGSWLITNVARVMSYNTTYGGQYGSPALWSGDYRSPLQTASSTNAVQTWDLRVWAMPIYAENDLRLSWYSNSAPWTDIDMPDIIGGVDYIYKLEVYSDPTGQHQGYTWTSTDPTGGSATDSLGALTWTGSYPKGDEFYAVDNGIKVRFTAEPISLGSAASVPEPSSFAALAAGLIGTAATLRRRGRSDQ